MILVMYFFRIDLVLTACKLDEDDSDFNDMVDRYSNPYRDCKLQCWLLLKKQNIQELIY